MIFFFLSLLLFGESNKSEYFHMIQAHTVASLLGLRIAIVVWHGLDEHIADLLSGMQQILHIRDEKRKRKEGRYTTETEIEHL